MENEERIVDGFKIINAIQIGDREVVLGAKEEGEIGEQYLCAFCTKNDFFTYYEDGFSGTYLEIMKLFNERVNKQIDKVVEEQQEITVPIEIISKEQCFPNDLSQSIENKIVCIKADVIRPEYRTATIQLVLVTGGFGASGNSRGSAVFCTNLYSGKHSRWERCDIQGEVRPEYLPDWARVRTSKLRQKSLDKKHQIKER